MQFSFYCSQDFSLIDKAKPEFIFHFFLKKGRRFPTDWIPWLFLFDLYLCECISVWLKDFRDREFLLSREYPRRLFDTLELPRCAAAYAENIPDWQDPSFQGKI